MGCSYQCRCEDATTRDGSGICLDEQATRRSVLSSAITARRAPPPIFYKFAAAAQIGMDFIIAQLEKKAADLRKVEVAKAVTNIREQMGKYELMVDDIAPVSLL